MATQLSGPVMPIKTVSLCILVKSHSVDKMLSQVQKCWEFAFFFSSNSIQVLYSVCLALQQSDDDTSPESLYFLDETFEPFF